jgi:hypothetical protein
MHLIGSLFGSWVENLPPTCTLGEKSNVAKVESLEEGENKEERGIVFRSGLNGRDCPRH